MEIGEHWETIQTIFQECRGIISLRQASFAKRRFYR